MSLELIRTPDINADDGRRQRSVRSRNKIIAAVQTLAQKGHVTPSAAEIAEAANVGLRTVFRHFREIDKQYLDLAKQTNTLVLELLKNQPSISKCPQSLLESIPKRVQVHEKMLGLESISTMKRFKFDFLVTNYQKYLAKERMCFQSALKSTSPTDAVLVSALQAVLSLQHWHHLRVNQNMSVEKSEEVLHFAVQKLLQT